MASRMDQFREFVSLHPLLRNEVKEGKRSWQGIYEEWVLYGEKDKQWDDYMVYKKEGNVNNDEDAYKTEKKQDLLSAMKLDNVRNVIDYVKKINPDKVNNTLNSVQKVIQIVQTVGGGKSVSVPKVASVFSDWWDS